MKIGILTFHCAYNFGAALQAFALQEFLNTTGHEAYIIDYRPEYLATKKPPLRICNIIHHPKRRLRDLNHLLSVRRFIEKFRKFEQKHFRLYDISSHNTTFDTVIIGSDQVWNKCYNGEDPIWFGNMPDNIKAGKVISYAASAGDATETQFSAKTAKSDLSHLAGVLVREKCLYDVLSSVGVESEVVLDPVLMTDPSVWQPWIKRQCKDKYIVLYQGREDENAYRIANELALQRNCKIIGVDLYNGSYKSPIQHRDIDPAQFITLVSGAECVVTTSFHGTAVSVVTNTPFYSLRLDDGADSRVADLLSHLDLTHRFIDKTSSPTYSPIDYTDVNIRLNTLRAESQQSLTELILNR